MRPVGQSTPPPPQPLSWQRCCLRYLHMINQEPIWENNQLPAPSLAEQETPLEDNTVTVN